MTDPARTGPGRPPRRRFLRIGTSVAAASVLALAGCAAPGQLQQFVGFGQQASTALHQQLSRRRQAGLASAPVHQFGAQARFQFAQVKADGGRGQVQRLCGGAACEEYQDLAKALAAYRD